MDSIQNPRVGKPSLLLLDVRLPGMSGIEVLRWMTNESPSIPVIMMTAFGDLRVAVDAIQGRAFEYLTKPFSLDLALQCVARGLQQKSQEKHSRDSVLDSPLQKDALLGNSLLMQGVYKQIAVAASVDLPVFIEGEVGTGKSLVASMVHRFSSRCNSPFLTYRTAEDSKSQCSADLFGIRIAVSDPMVQAGLLQLTAGGTLVINEIGLLPISTQEKLLEAIESGNFTAVSDSQPVTLQSRIAFCSRLSLGSLEEDSAILPTLRAQLEVCKIQIPPLRQRPEDIRQLANNFISLATVSSPLTITEQSLAELEKRQWLGNVRELRQAIQYGILRAKGGVIQPEDLPSDSRQVGCSTNIHDQVLREATKRWITLQNAEWKARSESRSPAVDSFLYEECLAIIEQAMIEQIMEDFDGNRVAAAMRLGIHRSTLRQKMKRYNLRDWDS